MQVTVETQGLRTGDHTGQRASLAETTIKPQTECVCHCLVTIGRCQSQATLYERTFTQHTISEAERQFSEGPFCLGGIVAGACVGVSLRVVSLPLLMKSPGLNQRPLP